MSACLCDDGVCWVCKVRYTQTLVSSAHTQALISSALLSGDTPGRLGHSCRGGHCSQQNAEQSQDTA